jgi:sugar phosphate isomerase/epimerase
MQRCGAMMAIFAGVRFFRVLIELVQRRRLMYVALRDAMVAGDTFTTPLAGLRHLQVDDVELELRRDLSIRALDTQDWVVLGSDADANGYRAHLESIHIRPCALLTACDFSTGESADNVAFVARSLELAAILGAPAVRIDSFMAHERELSFGKRVELFVRGLRAALDHTAGSTVAMGIENHGFQGNNLTFLLSVFKHVGSDRLGSTLDTGNFYWRGYPLSEVYAILELLAPHTKHTHLKNIRYPENHEEIAREAGWEYMTYVSPLDEGDIQHARVVAMLRDAGYDGALCIEDESIGKFPRDERPAVLERDVAHVKELIIAAEGTEE